MSAKSFSNRFDFLNIFLIVMGGLAITIMVMAYQSDQKLSNLKVAYERAEEDLTALYDASRKLANANLQLQASGSTLAKGENLPRGSYFLKTVPKDIKGAIPSPPDYERDPDPLDGYPDWQKWGVNIEWKTISPQQLAFYITNVERNHPEVKCDRVRLTEPNKLGDKWRAEVTFIRIVPLEEE